MNNDNTSKSLARLTISALERIRNDSSTWTNPVVYKVLLLSGIWVLITSIECIENDLFDK